MVRKSFPLNAHRAGNVFSKCLGRGQILQGLMIFKAKISSFVHVKFLLQGFTDGESHAKDLRSLSPQAASLNYFQLKILEWREGHLAIK